MEMLITLCHTYLYKIQRFCEISHVTEKDIA